MLSCCWLYTVPITSQREASSYRHANWIMWVTAAHCAKITKNVAFEIFHNFCAFLALLSTFVHSKCKRSSLRSQCWMRLFLWFSNTVMCYYATYANSNSRWWDYVKRTFMKAFNKIIGHNCVNSKHKFSSRQRDFNWCQGFLTPVSKKVLMYIHQHFLWVWQKVSVTFAVSKFLFNFLFIFYINYNFRFILYQEFLMQFFTFWT